MKPTLKTKKDTTFIDVSEWDKFVQEVYGKPYNFQQQDGCKDRGVCEFELPSKYSDVYEDVLTIPYELNGDEMGVKFEVWRDTPLEEIDTNLKNAKKDKYTKYSLECFLERNFYPFLDTLANDLHAKGLLPEGKYAIIVD